MDYCTIVCTGDSLRGFDFKNLHGYIIAVNYAYQYIDYDICVARDGLEKIVKEKVPNLETLKHHGGKWETQGIGVNRNRNFVTGYNCTLTTALNIAIHKGFKTIYVLGADNKAGDTIHFYDDKPDTWEAINQQVGFYNNVREFLIGFKEGLRDERLIFADSTIDMFESITLDEYVKRGNPLRLPPY